jgi:uncharacterized metal-binding protein YceD (DUF177 family)
MPEFERPVPLGRITARGTEVLVEATEAERAALARRFTLPAIDRLRCRFHLRRGLRGVVEADGLLDASVVQTCAVSLDEFPQAVAEAFELRFVPSSADASADWDDDDPDEPDVVPYEGTLLDLGEAAAEQLALALDPYPHKPGVSLPEAGTDGAEAHGSTPFTSLARLRRN